MYQLPERFLTHITLTHTLPCMSTQMHIPNTMECVQCLTNNNREWVFPSTRAQTNLHISLIAEKFLTSHENGQYTAQVHRRHFKLCCVLNYFLHMKLYAPHNKCVDDRPSGLPLLKISYIYYMKTDAPHCAVHVDRTCNNSPRWKISHKCHM